MKPPVSTALWASAFRPFYLLGALYAPLLVIAWLAMYFGLWHDPQSSVPLQFRHGHEFIFGFTAAIITGIVLTALPSWAGTEEICGRRLVLLVALVYVAYPFIATVPTFFNELSTANWWWALLGLTVSAGSH